MVLKSDNLFGIKVQPMRVVAAVVRKADSVFAVRYASHRAAGGRWEFLGGGRGCQLTDALVRECLLNTDTT